MSIECNLRSNRIGVITITKGHLKDFKMALNEVTKEYEVFSNKDGFIWSRAKSPKGAVIGACHNGIRLRDIDISETYVPLQEVIEVIKS